MTLVMVYVLFCVAVYVYPEAFFYGPSSKKSDITKARQNGYPAEEVSFKSADGTELPAWYTKPGKQNKIVVFMHGNSYNVEKFYNKMIPFVKAGYGTFMPEYRGFGGIKGRITQANLDYVGSITIDEELLEAANMIEGEKVQIVNVNNGERLETYIIKGERGSGAVCLNGPAARKCVVGDVVIIISYALMDFEAAKTFKPWVIFPDTETNRLVR